MSRCRVLPPVYLLIALFVMLALHVLLPLVQWIMLPWNLIGLIPLGLGITLNVIADNLFHQAFTTVRPGETSTALVTSGPFRLTRNPMYLGFVLVLVGVALLLGSLTPWIVIPLFALLIDRLFIKTEESMLAAAFGAAWQVYAQKTRRWL